MKQITSSFGQACDGAAVAGAVAVSNADLRAVLETLDDHLISLGTGVRRYDENLFRHYKRRQRRFATIVPRQNHVTLYLVVEPALAANLVATGALSDIGHYSLQNELVIFLETMGDLETVKPAIAQVYEANALKS